MNTLTVQPVILCGGTGTRLWPLSRAGFPKQFLCLTGKESLFQLAAQRLAGLNADNIAVAAPIVVTNDEHRFLAIEQLRESGLNASRFLLEPVARNTAPALTLAALAAYDAGADPILVVTPADQTIADENAFTLTLQSAIREAEEGKIVILGVTPDRPETGYGYIQAEADQKKSVLTVRRFVEKPDVATAQQYVDAGDYFWNAGIFVLKASVWLAALDTFRPDIAESSRLAWDKRNYDHAFIRPGEAEFAAIPNQSIDYAVIERCPGSSFPIAMAPLNAGWNDLGAWDAVWKVLPKDTGGNAHIGDVLSKDSYNNFVHASNRLVALVGVENMVVVETPDAVLIANLAHSQDVKAIVEQLGKCHREEQVVHRKVYRPWGWYDSVDEGPRFKVKRIQVKPKASLSLQKHHHRAEHWVVVKGTAEITCGDKTLLLSENQSTYIPLGQIHRLANPGNIPLEIIEVQSGSYLGEDDILRIEDDYNRH